MKTRLSNCDQHGGSQWQASYKYSIWNEFSVFIPIKKKQSNIIFKKVNSNPSLHNEAALVNDDHLIKLFLRRYPFLNPTKLDEAGQSDRQNNSCNRLFKPIQPCIIKIQTLSLQEHWLSWFFARNYQQKGRSHHYQQMRELAWTSNDLPAKNVWMIKTSFCYIFRNFYKLFVN